MQLTSGQITTFRTWLTNNAAGLSDQAAADLANTLASPAYFVWQTQVPKVAVDAQIVKANYTPTDTPPASTNAIQGTNDALLYNNRALSCQLKQTNAQWLTQGAGSIDARNTGVRQNFKDCLLAIPSGASGVSQDAGWGTAATPGAVRLAMMRQATNFEKLFVTVASGSGNAGGDARGLNTNPDLLGLDAVGAAIEGQVTSGQVAETRG